MESSAYDRSSFDLKMFALPRFIPTSSMYLTYGFPVGGLWNSVSNDTVAAVASSLNRLHSLSTCDGLVNAIHGWQVDLRKTELRFCIGIITDSIALARQSYAELQSWRITYRWEPEIIDRCNELAEVSLGAGGLQAGRGVLSDRRSITDRLFE